MLAHQSGSLIKKDVNANYSEDYSALEIRTSMKNSNVYDYTIFKIEHMIYELATEYVDHPDVYPLKLLLKMYMNKEIDIYWDGGYPMVGDVNF